MSSARRSPRATFLETVIPGPTPALACTRRHLAGTEGPSISWNAQHIVNLSLRISTPTRRVPQDVERAQRPFNAAASSTVNLRYMYISIQAKSAGFSHKVDSHSRNVVRLAAARRRECLHHGPFHEIRMKAVVAWRSILHNGQCLLGITRDILSFPGAVP